MVAGYQFADKRAVDMIGKIEKILNSIKGVTSATIETVSDFQKQFQNICVIEVSDSFMEKSQFLKQQENMRHTFNRLQYFIEARKKDKAKALIQYQLYPFLEEFRESFYFWSCVYPDRGRMEEYYKKEFARHHENCFIKDGEYEVSIFVPARNKLEYTKKCVESILKHTESMRKTCELILINHGSADETLAYFESVDDAKVIDFKENVGMVMFSAAFRACRGKTVVFVSNDTIVTKKWLSNLSRCLWSDDSIVMAVPTTPNTSNGQSIQKEYGDSKKMQRFAASFNVSNPKKWQERARLMPVIAAYKGELVNEIGFADRYFDSMEFWDDDFSLRARQAGYKQMLCRDVYCFHYGSVTGGEAQLEENTLIRGRYRFLEKHGSDAWGNGSCYDDRVIEIISRFEMPKEDTAILGVDCGYGDTPMQIRNVLRENGVQAEIYHINTEKIYTKDLEKLADGFIFSKNEDFLKTLQMAFDEKKFGYVYLTHGIEKYGHRALIEIVKEKLEPEGKFIFTVSNPYYYHRTRKLVKGIFPSSSEELRFINTVTMERYLENMFSSVFRFDLYVQLPQEELDLYSQLAGQEKEEVIKLTQVKEHIFLCVK